MTDAWQTDEPFDELEEPAPPPPPTDTERQAADAADVRGDVEPGVDVGNELEAVRNLTVAVRAGAVPELYVKHGQLVTVTEVSGTNTGVISDSPYRDALVIDPAKLRLLCATHLNTFRLRRQRRTPDAPLEREPALPSAEVCKVVLSQQHWPGVPRFTSMLRSPVVREDGTISQELGYDAATGTWLNPVATVPRVSEVPSEREVREARRFLLDGLLRDFPWVGPADRANMVALLFTQSLRRVIKGVAPLGVITAASPGSGKTLLADLVRVAHGGTLRSLPSADEELRKQLTTIFLTSTDTVTIFDNVSEEKRLDSPVLAQLLTATTWSDRILGGSTALSVVNDKLWMATGNNVRLGGDMVSRTVLVRIDPGVPDPSTRSVSDYTFGDLTAWLEDGRNLSELTWMMLTLVRSWAVAGMPERQRTMRSFTRWASVMGGFLEHHGIEGFMTNTDEVQSTDEEADNWEQFFERWRELHGERWFTSNELIRSSTPEWRDWSHDDPWHGTFPTRKDGKPLTTNMLGALLNGRKNRFVGGWVLRQETRAANKRYWRPERVTETTPHT